VANRLQNSPVGALDPAAPLLSLRGFCPTCGDGVTELRDELSFREYRISGMCQSCQDSVFGVDWEGPMEVATDPGLFETEEAADPADLLASD
jgi:hypothetical protein